MKRWFGALVVAGIAVACKGTGGEGDVEVRNPGDRAFVCQILEGTTPGEVQQYREVMKLEVGPGEAAVFSLPAGRYTLFPRQAGPNAPFSLSHHPFEVKAGQTVHVEVGAGERGMYGSQGRYVDGREGSGEP